MRIRSWTSTDSGTVPCASPSVWLEAIQMCSSFAGPDRILCVVWCLLLAAGPVHRRVDLSMRRLQFTIHGARAVAEVACLGEAASCFSTPCMIECLPYLEASHDRIGRLGRGELLAL